VGRCALQVSHGEVKSGSVLLSQYLPERDIRSLSLRAVRALEMDDAESAVRPKTQVVELVVLFKNESSGVHSLCRAWSVVNHTSQLRGEDCDVDRLCFLCVFSVAVRRCCLRMRAPHTSPPLSAKASLADSSELQPGAPLTLHRTPWRPGSSCKPRSE
jgi:hypothetical protein